jgi:hypothetical protein
MRNLTVLLSDNLQKYWPCRHTVMARSPFLAIGDKVAQSWLYSVYDMVISEL